MPRPAHHFGTTGKSGIGIAEHDHLAGAGDRLQAAAAKPVNSERRGTFAHAGTDRYTARDIHIARLGMDHITEDCMVDDIGGNTGLFNSGTGDMRAKVNR